MIAKGKHTHRNSKSKKTVISILYITSKLAIENRLNFLFRNESYFLITQEFSQTSFVEKIQVRAYTFDDLVGSCGGYIGLFLGYALIQIPRTIKVRFKSTKWKNSSLENDEISENVSTEDV